MHHSETSWYRQVQNSFLVNLVQKIIEMSQDLQKLLRNVYCHIFYGPQLVNICMTQDI